MSTMDRVLNIYYLNTFVLTSAWCDVVKKVIVYHKSSNWLDFPCLQNPVTLRCVQQAGNFELTP